MRERERERERESENIFKIRIMVLKSNIHGQEDTLFKMKLNLIWQKYGGTTGRGNKVIMRCARLHQKKQKRTYNHLVDSFGT